MKNYNCLVISPSNIEYEIPYYCLGEFCKKIVRQFLFQKNLDLKDALFRKKEFYEFQKKYTTFAPYFDFVFIKLGYKLKRPFLIPNSILDYQEINGDIYYYAHYLKEEKFLSSYNKNCVNNELFIQALEEKIVCKNVKQFVMQIPESYITKSGKILYMNTNIISHDFWANLWIHNYMMNSYEFCEKYISLIKNDFIYRGMELLLQEEKSWLRLARGDYGEYLIAVSTPNISFCQQQCISYIEKNYQRVLICK